MLPFYLEQEEGVRLGVVGRGGGEEGGRGWLVGYSVVVTQCVMV